MYVSRQHFIEESRALEIAREIGVGEFVTSGAHGFNATRLPFVVNSAGNDVVVETHLARVNPQWRDSGEVLLIVGGPDVHIPGHYLPPEPPESRMPYVPTWNYVTIHLRGELVVHDDAEWKQRHLDDLVAHHESTWRIDTHSSAGKVERAMNALVGMSFSVTEVLGKAKLHQNMSAADIEHIAHNVEGDSAEIAHLMREVALPWAQDRESRVHHVLKSKHQSSRND